MNDICNSISQCREYYAEELAAAATKKTSPVTKQDTAATTARSIADLKRDDYEQIPVVEKMLADQKAAEEAAKARKIAADSYRFYEKAMP